MVCDNKPYPIFEDCVEVKNWDSFVEQKNKEQWYMNQFKVKEYTINVCQDIYEWGREFYGVPENVELDNIEELTSTSMGFAMLDEKELWVYIPKGNKKECYHSTIAHEVGHIIEGGFKKNPSPRMVKLHEKKAEHYEQYFNTVMEIINYIENNILQ